MKHIEAPGILEVSVKHFGALALQGDLPIFNGQLIAQKRCQNGSIKLSHGHRNDTKRNPWHNLAYGNSLHLMKWIN